MKLKCCAICVVSGENGINEEENENLNEVFGYNRSGWVGVWRCVSRRSLLLLLLQQLW